MNKSKCPVTMRDAVLSAVYRQMCENSNIFFLTADFGAPVLDLIRKNCSNRFVNVGIAEQNLINVAAGLALEGFIVYAYAIAPFLTMRCFEQIRINLALTSQIRPINVNLIGVGAGYSYVVSGPTHQCYEDITVMRSLPNMTVYSPADHVVAEKICPHLSAQIGIKYIRLDAQILPAIYDQNISFNIPDGFYAYHDGEEFCILATGFMMHTAIKIARYYQETGYDIGLIDMFNLTSFDEEKFKLAIKKYKYLITLEEAFSGKGGMDSMIFDFSIRHHLEIKILNIGVQNRYEFAIGSRDFIHQRIGLDANTIINKMNVLFEKKYLYESNKDKISIDAQQHCS